MHITQFYATLPHFNDLPVQCRNPGWISVSPFLFTKLKLHVLRQENKVSMYTLKKEYKVFFYRIIAFYKVIVRWIRVSSFLFTKLKLYVLRQEYFLFQLYKVSISIFVREYNVFFDMSIALWQVIFRWISVFLSFFPVCCLPLFIRTFSSLLKDNMFSQDEIIISYPLTFHYRSILHCESNYGTLQLLWIEPKNKCKILL